MAALQQRFDEDSVTREEWAWVENLIRDVAKEEEGDRFARRLFQWDLAVEQFRKIEQKRIILGKPGKIDFEFHALCLHGLLTIGHALLMDSRRFTPEELARFQVKHEEVAAYVEELEQSFREWHHGFTEQELAKLRQAVLGAEA